MSDGKRQKGHHESFAGVAVGSPGVDHVVVNAVGWGQAMTDCAHLLAEDPAYVDCLLAGGDSLSQSIR